MQEENRSIRTKTCGSKFGLETKWTYSAKTRIEPGGPHSSDEVPLCYQLPIGVELDGVEWIILDQIEEYDNIVLICSNS